MKARWLIALFFVACAAFAVATLPLAVALSPLGGRGLGYSAATGTIWHGTLSGVFVNGIDLGEVSLDLAPLSLFTGNARLAVSARGGALTGGGRLQASLGGLLSANEVQIQGRMSDLPLLLPLAGTVRIQLDALRMRDGVCEVVRGRVRTDALARSGASLGWEGPVLSGEPNCEDGRLLLSLAGDRSGEHVAVDLSLALGDGDWRLAVTIDSSDPALAGILPSLGFAADDGRFRLVQTGNAAGAGGA